jgi:glyoxylase-like metal-dependent hydrolase (beta-lactamase superfamily II)
MEELRSGLWTWTAWHPEWKPTDGGPEGWEREVRSYAYDAGEALVLVDPQSPPALVDELADGKDVAVVLTCPWHARSGPELAERLGASLYGPASKDHEVEHPYRAGDVLPGGVEATAGLFPDEAVLWISAHGALVTGDLLIHRPDGLKLQPDSWLPKGKTREALREELAPLLELPVELVLPTHGDPIADGAAEALAEAVAA